MHPTHTDRIDQIIAEALARAKAASAAATAAWARARRPDAAVEFLSGRNFSPATRTYTVPRMGEKYTKVIVESLTKNNEWRTTLDASVAARAAMLALVRELIAATAEGREHGTDLALVDGQPGSGDCAMWSRGGKSVMFQRADDGKLCVLRKCLIDSDYDAFDFPAEPASGAWAESIVRDALVWLSSDSITTAKRPRTNA